MEIIYKPKNGTAVTVEGYFIPSSGVGVDSEIEALSKSELISTYIDGKLVSVEVKEPKPAPTTTTTK